MPAAVLAIGAVIGGTVAAVAGVVGGIVAAVGGLVAGVSLAVEGVVGTTLGGLIKGTLAVKSVVDAIKKPTFANIAGALYMVNEELIPVVNDISNKLGGAIGDLKGVIDNTTRPILQPIHEAWVSIKETIDAQKEVLAPVVDSIDEAAVAMNNYRDVKILAGILSSSEGVTKVVKYAEDGQLLDMAAAISALYKMTTATTIGILERQKQERETFDQKIGYIDQSIRGYINETQSETLANIYGKITGITGSILGRIATIDRKFEQIARRTEDLPWFQNMLLKALR